MARRMIKVLQVRFYEGEETILGDIKAMFASLPCSGATLHKLLLDWFAALTLDEQLDFMRKKYQTGGVDNESSS